MIYTDGVHLAADTLDELHAFARRLGLRREWFQDGRHPHYDLTTKRMALKAERCGAVKVTQRKIVEVAALVSEEVKG